MAGSRELPHRSRLSMLLVDEDASFTADLECRLRGNGYADIRTVRSHGKALLASYERAADRVIVELSLPSRSGLSLARHMHASAPGVRVLLMSRYPSRIATRDAIRCGAIDCVRKTLDVDLIEHHFAVPDTELEALEPTTLTIPRLETVEWEHVQLAMDVYHRNITRAAQALGISRNTLKQRLSSPAPLEQAELIEVAAARRLRDDDAGQ